MNDIVIYEIARQRHADLIAEAARASRARSAARAGRRHRPRPWAAAWMGSAAPTTHRPRGRGRARAQT
jgi:hypothetical protein